MSLKLIDWVNNNNNQIVNNDSNQIDFLCKMEVTFTSNILFPGSGSSFWFNDLGPVSMSCVHVEVRSLFWVLYSGPQFYFSIMP